MISDTNLTRGAYDIRRKVSPGYLAVIEAKDARLKERVDGLSQQSKEEVWRQGKDQQEAKRRGTSKIETLFWTGKGQQRR